jgi:hypothetical protein
MSRGISDISSGDTSKIGFCGWQDAIIPGGAPSRSPFFILCFSNIGKGGT